MCEEYDECPACGATLFCNSCRSHVYMYSCHHEGEGGLLMANKSDKLEIVRKMQREEFDAKVREYEKKIGWNMDLEDR